jgi:1-acyl-sn-glycerol-3-phosphate acyltransferase
LFYAIIQPMAYLFFRLFSRLEVRGREHIPPEGPFVLAANHESNLDPFLLGASTRRQLAYFAKAELFENRVIGCILRSLNAFPVRRGRMDRTAIQMCLGRLEDGFGLVLFPEGTRRRSGKRNSEPKTGTAMIAARTGVPLVPARIIGSSSLLPPGKSLPRPGKVRVVFGPPIITPPGDEGEGEGKSKKEIYREFTSLVMRQIYDLY